MDLELRKIDALFFKLKIHTRQREKPFYSLLMKFSPILTALLPTKNLVLCGNCTSDVRRLNYKDLSLWVKCEGY